MTDNEYDALSKAIELAHSVQERIFITHQLPDDELLALTDSLILMLSDIKEEREREEDFARCYRGEEESAEEEDDHGVY